MKRKLHRKIWDFSRRFCPIVLVKTFHFNFFPWLDRQEHFYFLVTSSKSLCVTRYVTLTFTVIYGHLRLHFGYIFLCGLFLKIILLNSSSFFCCFYCIFCDRFFVELENKSEKFKDTFFPSIFNWPLNKIDFKKVNSSH